MPANLLRLMLVVLGGTGFQPVVHAADDSKSIEFFEKKIRPLLSTHCLSCHSAEAAAKNKLKGGLYLDTKQGWKTGGDSGPAVVPGKPADSLLIETLKYDG